MEGKQRISINATIVLTIFALCIDLLQIFLDAVVIGVVVNRVIDVFVTILFWIMFKMMGVSFTKTRAFVFFGFALLEMFPGVDAFPLWTADVLAVCMMVMAEDRIPMLKGMQNSMSKKEMKALRKDPAALAKIRETAKGQALMNTGGGIIKALQENTKDIPRPTMSRTASRARQNYDAQLNRRDAQIAAQKEQKQNANQNSQNQA